MNVGFLEIAARKLKPAQESYHSGGVLRLMTDHLGYFTSMKEHLGDHGGWAEVPWQDKLERPITEFETIFLAKGDPIGRIAMTRR